MYPFCAKSFFELRVGTNKGGKGEKSRTFKIAEVGQGLHKLELDQEPLVLLGWRAIAAVA